MPEERSFTYLPWGELDIELPRGSGSAAADTSACCAAIAEPVDPLDPELALRFARKLPHANSYRMEGGVTLFFVGAGFRVATAECLQASRRLWPGRPASPLLIAVGHTVSQPEDIGYSYESARWLLRHSFIYASDGIMNLDSLTQDVSARHVDSELLAEYILADNRVALRRASREIGQHYRISPRNEADIKIDATQNFLKLLRYLEKKTDSHFSEPETDKWMERLRTAPSLAELLRNGLNSFYEISEKLARMRSLDPPDLVLAYLRRHYAEDVTLEEISGHLHYHAAYLGRLIRDKLGKNYNQLRDEIRMDQAARLLSETKYTVEDIASQVGFRDKDYFTRKFKSYYGESPRSYRSRFRT